MKKFIISTVFLSSLLYSQEYALSFDGYYDYVNIGRPVNMYDYDDATVSLWINTTQVPTTERAIFIGNDTTPDNPQFFMSIEPDGKVRVSGEGLASGGDQLLYSESVNS